MNNSPRSKKSPGIAVTRVILMTAVCLGLAAHDGASREEAAEQKSPPARATLIRWEKLPICLEAAAARDNANGSVIAWTSTRRELRTSGGILGFQLHDDEVALTLNNRLVAIGMDAQGKPIAAGESSLVVKAAPDCDAAAYVFVAPRTDRHGEGERHWLFDPRRTLRPEDPSLVEFPGVYAANTIVTLRDTALIVSSGTADSDDKAFQYHPDPVHSFVRVGGQPKYIELVGRPNEDFFHSVPASGAVRESAGDELFELLRTRTSTGKARVFQGRYFIVEGAAAGDFERHAAIVVDMIKGSSFFVACDDEGTDGGRLEAASRGNAAALERGGEEVLAAFRFAGFTLMFDDGVLRCDGDCHDERIDIALVH